MKSTVLVVDDEEKNRKLLNKILKTAGYSVLEAENGERALRIIQSNTVDIVLLDIVMPGMDGYEVCDRIKTNPYTKNIPIIILTGKGMDEGLAGAAKKKANFYIVKPYDYKVLLAQIETMLKKSKEGR
ncbi:MAG: hypothetical protein A2452_12005 [Candidatus Firestonebacteria bacterium RIFOXYC2_FULL_39_67]|nr:MAG: hypothetical protein A2536_00330 [Candidatus Firestonebacteria bacterium RIFOXYD2_FULL_39_29]OGF55690.1 MAG: hypothetical protein A2452_12005 [Candidatus Firestonebacteria bacterium RIFOXYC2_FULL_39_67]OGF57902.1 MAG: hypothetical protein A2497_04300 [Candidatus Firestonebacteria bacterium RifOxyC12_full_39_7]